eukprot:CAMPEP_0205928914 /NCGR_PEP_ID=MMETSP1325-20131115/25009_1 /ASSEMBLY_ACC=CAM_ASM_000708 /TAXON_ID=236786 /ORGANISM="Florenciella sp., Strain RCC1007" /LENGTH=48 /DNA_ID= /DNA_START= /DNA_END= /DNA_ORIENTATION=
MSQSSSSDLSRTSSFGIAVASFNNLAIASARAICPSNSVSGATNVVSA